MWGVTFICLLYSQNLENYENKLLGISSQEPNKIDKFNRLLYFETIPKDSNEETKLKWLNQLILKDERELFEKFIDFDNSRILDENGLNKFVNNLKYELLKEIDWLYVFEINVHHNFYQDELLPCENELKDLAVLCNKCHTDIINIMIKMLKRKVSSLVAGNVEVLVIYLNLIII